MVVPGRCIKPAANDAHMQRARKSAEILCASAEFGPFAVPAIDEIHNRVVEIVEIGILDV